MVNYQGKLPVKAKARIEKSVNTGGIAEATMYIKDDFHRSALKARHSWKMQRMDKFRW